MFPSPSSSHSIPKAGSLTWPRLGHVVAIILSWQVLRLENCNTRDWRLNVCTWPSCCGIYHNLIYHFIWDLYVGACQNPATVVNRPFIFMKGTLTTVAKSTVNHAQVVFRHCILWAFLCTICNDETRFAWDQRHAKQWKTPRHTMVTTIYPVNKNKTRTDVNLPFQCSVFFVA